VSTTVVPTRRTDSTRRARRGERRRLRRVDVLTARLAELDAIATLLAQAADVVDGGWVQGAWFTVADGAPSRVVTAFDLRRAVDRPVTGACLVGAVVHAGGGPRAARTQLVQRALDLTWHTLREDPDRPVRWGPGPRARGLQTLELTWWNDAPGRRPDEVVDLLRRCGGTVRAEVERARTELGSLA
jgi:hypothetical protein